MTVTDRECIRQLQAVRIFCTPEQVMAVDRAIAVLAQRAKKEQTP